MTVASIGPSWSAKAAFIALYLSRIRLRFESVSPLLP
jgi:hypothetical protein